MDRIIILNDDLESQMRMYLALCASYRIDIAENEVSLMRLLRRKRPNLLLLDAHNSRFNQNGKSAGKFIQKIKHKHKRVQILAITDGDERLGCTLQEHGADGWINRQIGSDELLARVHRVLALQMPFTFDLGGEEAEAETELSAPELS
jgi:DNA-binding response OmpR family regulator